MRFRGLGNSQACRGVMNEWFGVLFHYILLVFFS